MDVDRVKGKDKGKGKSKGKQKGNGYGGYASRKGRMARAKMPKERAKAYLQTPASSAAAKAIGARSAL